MEKLTKEKMIEELSINHLSHDAEDASDRIYKIILELNKVPELRKKLYDDEYESLARSVYVLLKIKRLCS